MGGEGGLIFIFKSLNLFQVVHAIIDTYTKWKGGSCVIYYFLYCTMVTGDYVPREWESATFAWGGGGGGFFQRILFIVSHNYILSKKGCLTIIFPVFLHKIIKQNNYKRKKERYMYNLVKDIL